MNLLRGITIGQHYPLDSVVHRLDPRTKIIAVVIYMIALFSASGPLGLALLSVFSLLAIRASRLPWRLLWRGLKPIAWIVGFTMVLQSFTSPLGRELWRWGPLAIYSGGALQGLMMSYRLVLMVLTTSLLTLTTSPITLTDGLERLLGVFKPLGLPAHELAMVMTIALRFIPTLIEEADKIAKAQSARGADFEEGNLLQRLQSLLPLLVPLFISAFRRADDLAVAMEARCYRGGEGRGSFRVLRRGPADVAVVLGMLALTAFIIALRWQGWDVWMWQ